MEGARNISPMVTVGRDGSMARLEHTNGLSKGLRNALGLEMFSLSSETLIPPDNLQ